MGGFLRLLVEPSASRGLGVGPRIGGVGRQCVVCRSIAFSAASFFSSGNRFCAEDYLCIVNDVFKTAHFFLPDFLCRLRGWHGELFRTNLARFPGLAASSFQCEDEFCSYFLEVLNSDTLTVHFLVLAFSLCPVWAVSEGGGLGEVTTS